jgi:AcrR family transcriptional regulator
LREQQLASAKELSTDPRARVARMGEAYVRFAADHPHHFRLMFLRPLEGASEELRRAAGASFAPLEKAIADAEALGILRPGLKKRDLAVAAWSLVHGLASLVVTGQIRMSPREHRRRVDALSAVFAEGAFVARG